VADATLVIGLSARTREFAPPLLDVDDACEAALREVANDSEHRVAFVFGTERIGLTIEQAQRCHRLAQIDAEPECSSLNLAQSVQVVSYELRRACLRQFKLASTREIDRERVVHADHEETEQFYAHLRRACEAVGFIDPAHPKKLFERMRRLFARTRLEREEVHLLRGLCKQMILAGEALRQKF
jgi:tRNA/rRNA methyltransferase